MKFGYTIVYVDWRAIQETLYLTSIPGMRSGESTFSMFMRFWTT